MTMILFFFLGVAQDFMGGSWVWNIKKCSYKACTYAFLWSCINSFFILTLAKSLDWTLVPVYASGIATGTFFVIKIQKRGKHE